MDEFVTPYDDDDALFIECKVCEKSIRGEVLYKIHVTSPGHLKKEEALVAVGHPVQRQNIPVFEDIVHYLDYMKLDEPIIGLNYLRELPNNETQGDPRYMCSLCNQTAHLTEMVRHLIGRKHRQKYVETKRPDLVTWNKRESQGGKIFKAKAEMIERQDGRGHPVLMPKRSKDARFHASGGQPWQNPNRNQKSSLTPQDVPTHVQGIMDFRSRFGPQGVDAQQQQNTPSFYQEDASMSNQDHRDVHSRGHFEENARRVDHMERDGCRLGQRDPDYHGNYEEQYGQRADEFESRIPKCESRSEMPHGPPRSSSQEDYYIEGPFRRGYPERDPRGIFRTEEIRNEQGRSSEYDLLCPNDDSHHWSQDRRQGSREPESTRKSFPTWVASDQSHDLLANSQVMQDQNIGEPYNKEARPEPTRPGLSNLKREDNVPRFMSDIPEPFKRFLKGGTNVSEQGKRKRKSRFSDASVEEVAKTRRMFEECGSSELKFGSYHSSDHPSLRREMHETPHSALTQGPHHHENDRRGREGGSGKKVIFDMLDNVEIENKEEADFLKSKLCDLLKEFKAKKSFNAEKNPSRASISKDFNSSNPDYSLPTRHIYEQGLRETSDYSQQVERPNQRPYHEDHRESNWEPRGHNIPEVDHQEYNHFMCAEPQYPSSTRNHHEDVFVQSEISSRQHGIHLSDAPSYPQRSLEPMYSHGDEKYSDIPSAPSHNMEREQRMEKSSLYSSNLEKITTTLLELVRRH